MATNLEILEKILLRAALQEENPEKLKKIDKELIEFASKGTVTLTMSDDK